MTSLRTKGKSTIVWILMGLLLLGLGGFGVTNFSGSAATEIGEVGETPVDADTYARALGGELQAMAQQSGQRLTMDQARAAGIPQAVQAQLFSSAALGEEARRAGVSVGDATVADAIMTAPAFSGPTGFDRAAYAEVLRREGLSESRFEREVREDEARLILQQAVVSGVEAPEAQTRATAAWLLEQRDISWAELTAADLPAPITPADDDTLVAWHQANAARFTAPETRRITYAWVTPEMLADSVELDEAALRSAYEENLGEYQRPARRLVGRLVFESAEAAAAARSRIDAGEASFETIAQERGLTLADTDLGEMTEAELGSAGAEVFAASDTGVVGPVASDLGPALYSVNAILDPVEISFEEALPTLRAEAAADRARRIIAEQSADIEDRLASGATLEDLAAETPMELGQIDWHSGVSGQPGDIAGYAVFREQAGTVAADDFPELAELDDGGIFALRLDEVVEPTLIPFEEVRERVAADWVAAEIQRQLVAMAEDLRLDLVSGEDIAAAEETASADAAAAPAPGQDGDAAPAPAADTAPGATAAASPEDGAEAGAGQPALRWQSEAGVTRDGWIEAAPPAVLTTAFRLEEGETDIVSDRGRVAIVRVDRVRPADLEGAEAQEIVAATAERLSRSLRSDLFDYYARAAQARNGVRLNAAAIAAVESRL